MILNGRVGQVIGPFTKDKDLLDDDGQIGKLTPETTRPILIKLTIQANEGTKVKINDMSIQIGKSGIYELDRIVEIKKLAFENDDTEGVIVDFVY